MSEDDEILTQTHEGAIGEIESETMLHLLNSVSHNTSPPGFSGISTLDTLLSAIAYNGSALNIGDVIEIQGPAASAKSELAYCITVNCILPDEVVFTSTASTLLSQLSVTVGGWHQGAIVMDMDARWDITRISRLLRSRLEKVMPKETEEFIPSLDVLVTDCLRRLHISRPRSSLSLAAALLNIPRYHEMHMPLQKLGLLVIDSLSSSYWQDRYESERKGTQDKSHCEETSPLNHVLVALQKLRLSLGPPIVLTNWGILSTPQREIDDREDTRHEVPLYRQHLAPFPAPFEAMERKMANAHLYPPVTHHITLAPKSEDARSFNVRQAHATFEQDDAYSLFSGALRIPGDAKVSFFEFDVREAGILSWTIDSK